MRSVPATAAATGSGSHVVADVHKVPMASEPVRLADASAMVGVRRSSRRSPPSHDSSAARRSAMDAATRDTTVVAGASVSRSCAKVCAETVVDGLVGVPSIDELLRPPSHEACNGAGDDSAPTALPRDNTRRCCVVEGALLVVITGGATVGAGGGGGSEGSLPWWALIDRESEPLTVGDEAESCPEDVDFAGSRNVGNGEGTAPSGGHTAAWEEGGGSPSAASASSVDGNNPPTGPRVGKCR